MERTPECSFDNPLNIAPQINKSSCQKIRLFYWEKFVFYNQKTI